MRVILLCILLVAVSAATVPFIDMWEEIKDVKCMAETYKVISLRVYQSIGKVEPNFAKNIEHLKPFLDKVYVGGYMMPCLTCPAEKQVTEIADAIKNTKIDMVSVSVEGRGWDRDRSKNIAFLKSIFEQYGKHGMKGAIITNERSWDEIMGRDCHEFSTIPLWYVRHDNDPENNRFRPFGGWTKVMAKQYASGEVCGNSVAKDSQYT
jgi:hypothetical protein